MMMMIFVKFWLFAEFTFFASPYFEHDAYMYTPIMLYTYWTPLSQSFSLAWIYLSDKYLQVSVHFSVHLCCMGSNVVVGRECDGIGSEWGSRRWLAAGRRCLHEIHLYVVHATRMSRSLHSLRDRPSKPIKSSRPLSTTAYRACAVTGWYSARRSFARARDLSLAIGEVYYRRQCIESEESVSVARVTGQNLLDIWAKV